MFRNHFFFLFLSGFRYNNKKKENKLYYNAVYVHLAYKL